MDATLPQMGVLRDGWVCSAQEGDAMGHSYLSTPRDSEDLMKEVILLAACSAGEVLPQTPDLPADVFTACLTTPIKARACSIGLKKKCDWLSGVAWKWHEDGRDCIQQPRAHAQNLGTYC